MGMDELSPVHEIIERIEDELFSAAIFFSSAHWLSWRILQNLFETKILDKHSKAKNMVM